jgi:hypothetical protein
MLSSGYRNQPLLDTTWLYVGQIAQDLAGIPLFP